MHAVYVSDRVTILTFNRANLIVTSCIKSNTNLDEYMQILAIAAFSPHIVLVRPAILLLGPSKDETGSTKKCSNVFLENVLGCLS